MDPAQAIAMKTPPVVLESTLEQLRTLLLQQSSNIDATDALMKKFIIPFDRVIECGDKGEKPFLACYYNRVGDNKYRSPWTNKVHPKEDNANNSSSSNNNASRRPTENENLRGLEKSFNDVWDSYKNLYYGNDSIGSVYLRESPDKGVAFQGMFGIRKRSATGSWDSVSLVTVDEPTDKECTYRVDTYVRMVVLPEVDGGSGTNTATDVSLTLSKENAVVTCKIFRDKIPINVSHIEHVGTIIEDSEMELRSIMETVHIPKNYETLITLQKQPTAKNPSNPVMGLMIDSGVLKKRFAASSTGTTDQSSSSEDKIHVKETVSSRASIGTTAGTTKRPGGIPAGVNPLMAGAMNSKILLKKKQQQDK